MKVFSTEQIRTADKLTIERQGITSLSLMERAAKHAFERILTRIPSKKSRVVVICGVGNNGGDGLVIGRYLLEEGYDAYIFILEFSKDHSHDFTRNLERLKRLGVNPVTIAEGERPEFPLFTEFIIDAVFGSGLSRPPASWIREIFDLVNKHPAEVISIDVPSGLYLDRVPDFDDQVIRADHCLSFQFPKLVFLLPGFGKYCLSWEIVPIGLDERYIEETEPLAFYVDKGYLKRVFHERDRFSHKGDQGHTLVVGGSYGKMGAIRMTGEAALRSGSGLVSAYVPECGYLVLQIAIPEIMVFTDEDSKKITSIIPASAYSSVAIGPGMGTDEKTAVAFADFIRTLNKPIVIDADALNILATHPELLRELPAGSVLTPHPGELKRLIGNWDDDLQKISKVKEFSKNYAVVVVVKGAHTMITDGKKLYFNSTGNPGMATGGSGDILTGVIAGLIAQGYKGKQAAMLGVYLHGLAGDFAAERQGEEAMVATDIIAHLGEAFIDLLIDDY
ncbi:NAD(P)H-hydrate dehydratase [Robertkochia solimangrovi]|uniref:NAD(P)H-hydrate dehydratase n=1 Tax=Robertkochia solimangrovi TaxID=2213046 RepID=UPI00117F788A|nr:NAD(P)H-hydrate dehydratase [Robertkochia solimangrovi]TRZ42909.1 bifunctional ADP-dependent NAD(P)H-hydrate dehydratase/NAD(P)H-hydrate epimerase [Robertkochia solimangrovi]